MKFIGYSYQYVRWPQLLKRSASMDTDIEHISACIMENTCCVCACMLYNPAATAAVSCNRTARYRLLLKVNFYWELDLSGIWVMRCERCAGFCAPVSPIVQESALDVFALKNRRTYTNTMSALCGGYVNLVERIGRTQWTQEELRKFRIETTYDIGEFLFMLY
jgi:hypothetical protein